MKKKKVFDHWKNYKFIIVAAMGLAIIMISSLVKTYMLNVTIWKMNSNYEALRFFSSNYHDLLLFQSKSFVMKYGSDNRYESVKTNYENYEQATLRRIEDLLNAHVNICIQFQDSIFHEQINTLRNKDIYKLTDLSGFVFPISLLTILTYDAMEQELTIGVNRISNERNIFVLIHLFGSFLLLFGGLRWYKGKLTLESKLNWAAGFIILLSWILQSYYYDKWEDRLKFINEIKYNSRITRNIDLLQLQTIEIIKVSNYSQKNEIEKSIFQSLSTNSIRYADFILNQLSAKDYPEMSNQYSHLMLQHENIKNYFEYLSWTFENLNFRRLCWLKLDNEVSYLHHYQTISKYVLTILSIFATILFVLGKFKSSQADI